MRMRYMDLMQSWVIKYRTINGSHLEKVTWL